MNNLESAIFEYENNFVGICDLARKYKIPNKTIREALEAKGYFLGKGVSPKSVVNIKKAIDEYKTILDSGKEPNIFHLSQKYNVSHVSIKDNLNRLNITVVRYPKKIQFDEHVFDTIDTEEKAYWLGFLSADGYITNKYNTVGLSLAAKDREHVQKFANFLGCPDNIKFKSNLYNGAYFCEVGNAHLKNTLIQYGFTPTKSYDLKFPDIKIFENEDLIRHFLRGHFEGDGCITFSKRFRKRAEDWYCTKQVGLVGTEEYIIGFKKFFNLDNVITKDREHACWEIRIQGHAQEVLDYLYKDASIYLDRKFKLYKIAPHFVWTNVEKPFNIEELCDENIEIISNNKELETSYSVETEPDLSE